MSRFKVTSSRESMNGSQTKAGENDDEQNDFLSDLPSSSSKGNFYAPNGSGVTAVGSAAALRRDHSRRHSRIHSRNLSVFFPQPESEAEREADIISAQDTLTQRPRVELDIQGVVDEKRTEDRLRPSSEAHTVHHIMGTSNPHSIETTVSPTKSRKGHHRRHSVVHSPDQDAHYNTLGNGKAKPLAKVVPEIESHRSYHQEVLAAFSFSPAAFVFGVCELLLGFYTWWKGQSGDSLAMAGLGYLSVFDASGILSPMAATTILKSRRESQVKMRSNALGYAELRVVTLLHFTQTIFLLFAAIYICKESVEHALLEGSNEDHEEDDIGLHLSLILLLLSAATTMFSNVGMRNHAQLVAAGNLSTLASESTSSRHAASLRNRHGRHASVLANPNVIAGPFLDLLTNPFSVMIIFFNFALTACTLTLHPLQVAALDKVLAGLQSAAMLYVAFPSSKALGKILLQTAPSAHDTQSIQLMRSMRTIEEHPLVDCIIPPKLWQLTPPSMVRTVVAPTKGVSFSSTSPGFPQSLLKNAVLISSIEILVHDKASDSDILDLTRWAWQLLSPSVGASAGLEVGDSLRGSSRAGEITVQVLRHRDFGHLPLHQYDFQQSCEHNHPHDHQHDHQYDHQ